MSLVSQGKLTLALTCAQPCGEGLLHMSVPLIHPR